MISWLLNPLRFVNFCTLSIFGSILSTVGSVVGIGSGLNSLFGGGGSSSGTAQTASQLADPAQSYRPGWASQLNNLLTGGPAGLTSNPMFQAMQTQSTDTLERQMAASGQTMSGQNKIDLHNLDNSNMLNYWYQMMNPYMNLIGTPAGGATGYLSGMNLGNQIGNQGWSSIAQGLGGLQNIYGSGSSNTSWGSGIGDTSQMSYPPGQDPFSPQSFGIGSGQSTP